MTHSPTSCGWLGDYVHFSTVKQYARRYASGQYHAGRGRLFERHSLPSLLASPAPEDVRDELVRHLRHVKFLRLMGFGRPADARASVRRSHARWNRSVRCVRGGGPGKGPAELAVAPPNQYTVVAPGEVADHYTGLVWQEGQSSSTMPYADRCAREVLPTSSTV